MTADSQGTVTPAQPASLVRGLGLAGAVSVNIANMVGTGVFLKTRVMTCNVGSPELVLLVWIAAGLLALAGALTYAELSAMMPRAGGEYVYIREAYGRRWGFLFGWTQFAVARTASQAALAIGFAIFLNILLGGALDGAWITVNVFGWPVPFGGLQVVALGILGFATLINCAAVAFGGAVASWLTVVKIGLVLAIGAGALFFAPGDWGPLLESGRPPAAGWPALARRCWVRSGRTTAGTTSRRSPGRSGTRSARCRAPSCSACSSSAGCTYSRTSRTSTCSRRPKSPTCRSLHPWRPRWRAASWGRRRSPRWPPR
jgi:amino acid transporter